jgi:hypothetical protein
MFCGWYNEMTMGSSFFIKEQRGAFLSQPIFLDFPFASAIILNKYLFHHHKIECLFGADPAHDSMSIG